MRIRGGTVEDGGVTEDGGKGFVRMEGGLGEDEWRGW